MRHDSVESTIARRDSAKSMEHQTINTSGDNGSGANTVLIVVVILILAFFGYWWYNNRRSAAPANNGAINVDVNLPAGTGAATTPEPAQ